MALSSQEKNPRNDRDPGNITQSTRGFLTRIGLVSPLTEHQRAVEKVIKDLSVEVDRKSHMISLSFQAYGPRLAQRTLDSLITFYLKRHIEVHQDQASPTFFHQQTQRLLRELTEKERQLEEFRSRYSIASIDEEKEALLTQISTLRNRLDEVVGNVASSKARVASLERSLQTLAPTTELHRVTGKTNTAADKIKERLIDFRLKEMNLAARYPDDYRKLVDLRSQIRLAEMELADEAHTHTEITTGIDTNYQTILLALDTEGAQLRAMVARRNTLTRALKTRGGELAAIASHEVALTRLTRQIDIAAAEYREYRDNLQRAAISAALDTDKVSNISVVQPATLSLDPVKPRKLLNMTLAVFLGIFGGLGIAFILEALDDSLKSIEDVKRRLGRRVLVTLSDEEFRQCI